MSDSSIKVTPGTGTDPDVATDTLADGRRAQQIKLLDGTDGSENKAIVTAAGALKVDASGATVPVSFAGGVAVNNGAGASAVNVQDGGNSLSVDDGGGSLTVDGTVGISGTVSVSGAVTANIGTSGSLALDATLTGGAQKTKLVDSGGTNVAAVSAGGALKVDGSAVTQPVSGNVGLAPQTGGGLSISRTLAAASTNATSIKAGAGQVFGIYAHNTNAAVRFLKLYNKASAPTVGTDTPVLTLPIPGNAAGAGFVLEQANGIVFSTGIALALTTGVADADTGAVAANEIVVNLFYK